MSTQKIQTSTAKPVPPTQEQIAALAHEIWRERGSPEGSDIDIWLEAERQLSGGPTMRRHADPIPADPARPGADRDPAVNPSVDRQLRSAGGTAGTKQRSPTAFGV